MTSFTSRSTSGAPIFSSLSITNYPWFMMRYFYFGMNAENMRHYKHTHYKSSNAAASEGDIGPSTPTACNRYVCIYTICVRCIVTVTWWTWRLLKLVVATQDNLITTMMWIHQIGEVAQSICFFWCACKYQSCSYWTSRWPSPSTPNEYLPPSFPLITSQRWDYAGAEGMISDE